MATLLAKLDEQRRLRFEQERQRVLRELREALVDLLPGGSRVWVFGSLNCAGKFGDHSDVDIAMETRPAAFSEYWLQGELELRLGRRVDVLLMDETRFRETIQREGVPWTL